MAEVGPPLTGGGGGAPPPPPPPPPGGNGGGDREVDEAEELEFDDGAWDTDDEVAAEDERTLLSGSAIAAFLSGERGVLDFTRQQRDNYRNFLVTGIPWPRRLQSGRFNDWIERHPQPPPLRRPPTGEPGGPTRRRPDRAGRRPNPMRPNFLRRPPSGAP